MPRSSSANVAGLQHARSLTRWLDRIANWLPWIGLVLLACGVLLSRRRRRALVISVLCVGGGMVVVGIGILIGRGVVLDAVASPAVTKDTAGRVFDTLVRYLRWGIRLVLLLALLVAVGVWVSGLGVLAARVRRLAARGPRALGSSVNTGPVGAFVVLLLVIEAMRASAHRRVDAADPAGPTTRSTSRAVSERRLT